VRMKTIIGLLVISGILITGAVYAAGNLNQNRIKDCQNVDIEKVKQFQNETSALRDDLVIKKMELRNEEMKQDPDKDKIATLRNEIIEIRNKIRGVADKYEVPMQCIKYRGRNMHKNPSQSE
jgi:glutamine synthetase type III